MELALFIAAPIGIVCILILIIYSLMQQRKRRLNQLIFRRVEDGSFEAPDHPILGGTSLRDMIEMTTSGSGSGVFSNFFLL